MEKTLSTNIGSSNLSKADEILAMSGLQSITLSALTLPFWRSPIFIVAILKLGASIKPLDELISMLKKPFNDYEENHKFLMPPKENEDIKNTFCGT